MKIWKLLIPFCAMVVVGCASTGGADGDGSGAGGDGASTSGAGGDGAGSATAIGSDLDAESLMNDRIIYFAFDSAEIDSNSLELIRRHGAYMADNPGAKARLEGHADERGSREYNIGLGERRAASVQSVLLVQGAAADQLTTISFGEERPANTGTGDAAWAQNRRVEIVYD